MSDLGLSVLFVVVLIPSVILHEVAHGISALWLGDDTAQRAGRLTLNPLRHIDPFGSVILPALLAFSSAGVFGYAKPVPVNPARLRSPRNHSVVVSLAGPATNIAIALAAAIALRSVVAVPATEDDASLVWWTLLAAGFVNSALAVFNLVPLPPLDGSAVVERLMPRSLWPRYLSLRKYSMGVLLILLLVAPGVLAPVFNWALDTWIGVAALSGG